MWSYNGLTMIPGLRNKLKYVAISPYSWVLHMITSAIMLYTNESYFA